MTQNNIDDVRHELFLAFDAGEISETEYRITDRTLGEL